MDAKAEPPVGTSPTARRSAGGAGPADRETERQPDPAAELASVEQPSAEQPSVEQLARLLTNRVASALGPEIRLKLSVHDNRSTMISFRRALPMLVIRVHHMFLSAPEPIATALAEYAGKGKAAAGTLLDSYIADQQARIRARPRRSSTLPSRGKCFDLAQILERLNGEFFQSGVAATIGWGRQPGRRRRKSIRLGVYDHAAREIRIHPALDSPDVPLFFVEYIVFHEMLHQLFPSGRHIGRHVHHPRAFRDRERSFPKYEVALAWERQNLARLLRR
jgi:hypothetical protein